MPSILILFLSFSLCLAVESSPQPTIKLIKKVLAENQAYLNLGEDLYQTVPDFMNRLDESSRKFLAAKGSLVGSNQNSVFIKEKLETILTYSIGNPPKLLWSVTEKRPVDPNLGIESIATSDGGIVNSIRGVGLKRYNSFGKLVAEYKTDKNIRARFEFPDGSIWADEQRKSYFFSSDLKLTRSVEDCGVGLGPAFSQYICCAKINQKVFLDSKGEAFKKGDPQAISWLSLPYGGYAYASGDGYLYILDSNFTKVASHFHDTNFIKQIYLVKSNIIAYQNRTELVFIDLHGKEIGTYKLDYERVSQNDAGRIGILGDGQFVLYSPLILAAKDRYNYFFEIK